MAYYKFAKAMIKGESIDLYNNGIMKRDFTYITDIIEGVVRVIDRIPTPKNNEFSATSPPYRLYNIGNNNSSESFLNGLIKSFNLVFLLLLICARL